MERHLYMYFVGTEGRKTVEISSPFGALALPATVFTVLYHSLHPPK